jgi:hypothetical protein
VIVLDQGTDPYLPGESAENHKTAAKTYGLWHQIFFLFCDTVSICDTVSNSYFVTLLVSHIWDTVSISYFVTLSVSHIIQRRSVI